MPTLNGLEATRILRSVLPSCEVIVLSQHDSPEMARQAFRAGARGYVIKASVSQNLMAALDKVSRHESFFDPAVSEIARPLDVQEILQRQPAAFEQALHESEQVYRSTFELAAVGVSHVTPDGRWLRVNRKLCEILGYSEEVILQLTFQEVTHPDDLAADLAETEKVRVGEVAHLHDGKALHSERSIHCVGEHDSFGGSRCQRQHEIFHHGNRRHHRPPRSRSSTCATRRHCRLVSHDAVVSKTLNGIITSWNGGAARIFGYTAEEAVEGRPIAIVIPQALRSRNARSFDGFATANASNISKPFVSQIGSQDRRVADRISPVRDSAGRIIGASKMRAISRTPASRQLATASPS